MINARHLQEWKDSKVDESIINLNVKSLSGSTPYEYLLYGLPNNARRNDGRLRDVYLNSYSHTEHGGWWCSGVDVLTGEDREWGCFKPDRPRTKEKLQKRSKGFDPNSKTKTIKYEHPPKVATEIFTLRVELPIWQRIAARFDVELPEKIVVDERGEAIGFWTWVLNNPSIPVIVTEGAKKAGAIITAGHVAIALPGIYGGYRQPKNDWGQKIGKPSLIPQLLAFAQKGREIAFCFDRDTKPETVKNVRTAIAKTGKLLTFEGCSVSVITWDEPFKGVDDLIAAIGVDCFNSLYMSRKPLEKFQIDVSLDLSPYVSLRVNERYLSESLTAPPDAQLLALKSAKGTGKTEWLARIVERAIGSGQRVIVLTHREQLARALSNRLGVEYRTSVKTSVTRGIIGYSLCIDSLHPHANPPFRVDEWFGALVVIDEVEQVLWHLLESGTCRDNRVAIIDSFQQLLQTVMGTGGKVMVADADLSPIAIDYLKKLINIPVNTWVVDNTFNPNANKRKLITYSGNEPSQLVSALVQKIADGEKVLIHTSGQKKKSLWGTTNLESYLSRLFPEKRILRIDSESVADPNHPAFGCMDKLSTTLLEYEIVIASPVVETGVSIDIKGHFDSVWGIAQGVQTVEAVCQSLERLRDDVPRHLWAKKTARFAAIGNGATNVKQLLASQHKLTALNISLLQQASISEFDDLDINYSPVSLWTWAKRACVVNAGKHNYRAEIVQKLLLEGYLKAEPDESEIASPRRFASADSEIIKEEIKLTRDTNYREHTLEVASVDLPTEHEMKQLDKKRAKTKTERLAERKGNLAKRYGVEVTPELVEKDDNGWYLRLQLHYYLTIGNKYLIERDKRSLSQMNEKGQGKVFKPDVNKRLLLPIVKTLETVEIKQFLDPTAEFTHSNLSEWFERVKGWRHEIKSLLGVSINPEKDTPIAVAQRILKKLGLRLEFKYWRGDSKNKHRVYSGCNLNPDERDFIFEQWLERDEKKYSSDTIHTLSNKYIYGEGENIA
jgi:Domain of unknown function (DUF3854)